MLWLSCLFALFTLSAFCFAEIREAMSGTLLVAWLIVALLLTELTLIDSLRNQRVRRKVVFACLLHFLPILPALAYWLWKCGKGGARAKAEA